MIKPQIPLNEKERLVALESFHILDTTEEEAYDAITRIAAAMFHTPMALVSLIDTDRQWFKSHHGIEVTETPRELAFCAHAINAPHDLLIVEDSTKDARFKNNPLVIDEPKVRFYAGAPLNTKDGLPIGTLCVIDTKPRTDFTPEQEASLKSLANQVMAQLELRRQNIHQKLINEELTQKNDQLKHFTYRLAHDMKTPLHGISTLVGFIKEDYLDFLKETEIPDWLNTIDDRVSYMEALINGIIKYTNFMNGQIQFNSFNIAEELKGIEEKIGLTPHLDLVLTNCHHQINHSLNGFVQIFSELMTNSLKFSEQGQARIEIAFCEEDDYYTFTYEDDGPGVPEQLWDKVFLMFETIKRTNATDTGLGLATVKAIIEKLGGTIELGRRKENRSGIRFYFTLAKKKPYTSRLA
ncbi:sensor histidine kinase [Pseudozobellia thermophila]|uniref:histidine kinase n=1 Tax=Pseudozobellia thermophila TaxID=192903 RepID=A0A1M6J4A0_9FLAO|nr:GAF domain-containing sensor histidine kinase [Pseudozobellia thermophila]SHJ41515.1 GAF domain-containing protein [Pseudozobellia thermophila]